MTVVKKKIAVRVVAVVVGAVVVVYLCLETNIGFRHKSARAKA